MKVLDIVQRTPEWYAARAGRLTGSAADSVIAVRKRGTGELKERIDLRKRLVVERLTGRSVESGNGFKSDAMQRGCDLEGAAFVAYEAETGQMVQRVGFVQHDSLMVGCSPDGYVGEWEGLIELKCPESTTHLEYRQGGVVPEEYRGQILHNLWVTGAAWCDFVSFDDRFPDDLQLFIVRQQRVQADIDAYALAAQLFLSEVEKELSAVRGTAAA